ncbi:response regulator [Pseudomonas sp. Ma2-10]
MLKAMIVDDHPFIRSAVKMILKQEEYEIVAEAGNGADAVQLAREHLPDLILLDIAMPGVDGLDALSRMASHRISAKVLVLTSLSAVFYSLRCMKAGASGYVSKSDDLSELIKAINAIKSGYTFFPDLAIKSVHREDAQATESKLIQSLSDRELSILQQLANGLTNKQIGEAMLLSNKTISTYKARLIEKLNITSLIHMAEFAKRNGVI